MGAAVLICRACDARWYSAAADQMVARGAPCPACGEGPLEMLSDEDREVARDEDGADRP